MTTQLKPFLKTAVAVVALAFASVANAQDAVSKADKEFLKNAAELGLTEVEMGKLGQSKATAPELKEFSARLVKDHTKANSELMALAKKKGVEFAKEPSAAQKRMLAAFADKSGAKFDSEFREHAAKDHEKGIKMMQDAAEDTKDADIKAFATKQIPIMQEHHAMLQGKADARTTERTERKAGGTQPAPATESKAGGRVKTE